MWSAPAFKYQVQLNASDGRMETACVWTQISSELAETTFLWSAIVYWESVEVQICTFQPGREKKNNNTGLGVK